jgi:hypothetical protein
MMRAEINTPVRQWWEATPATEHPSPHSRQAGVTRPVCCHVGCHGCIQSCQRRRARPGTGEMAAAQAGPRGYECLRVVQQILKFACHVCSRLALRIQATFWGGKISLPEKTHLLEIKQKQIAPFHKRIRKDISSIFEIRSNSSSQYSDPER